MSEMPVPGGTVPASAVPFWRGSSAEVRAQVVAKTEALVARKAEFDDVFRRIDRPNMPQLLALYELHAVGGEILRRYDDFVRAQNECIEALRSFDRLCKIRFDQGIGF